MLSNSAVSRIAFALSIAGILLLLFAQQPEKKTVSEAIASGNGKLVEITAMVAWARLEQQKIVFELDDGNAIIAQISNPGKEQKSLLWKGNSVSATGTVSGKKGNKLFNVESMASAKGA